MELTPLIDVIFLLLTFFIFALTLMVQARLLDIKAPILGAGALARPGTAITIVLKADGTLALNGETIPRNEIIARVREMREIAPETRLFVAADENGRSGDLLALVDILAGAGLGDFSLVGRPPEAPESPEAAPP